MTLRITTIALFFSLVSFAACTSGTAGKRIELQFALESIPSDGEEVGHFTTETGWEVVLEEARLALGPLYAYPPSGDTTARRIDALVLSRAFAHGGFDPLNGRRVRAEMLDQQNFDALEGAPMPLGIVDGSAGIVEEVTVLLDPLDATDADLHGHQAWVVGTATKDEVTVHFDGSLDIEEGLQRRIEAVRGDATVTIDEGSQLVLGLHLHRWFDFAHFERLGEPAEGEDTVHITEDSQVRGAWFLGARAPEAFEIRAIAQGEQ